MTRTPTDGRPAPVHRLTVTVEDWFQVSAFHGRIEPRIWTRFESRLEQNLERALALLDRHRARATFFVLGWIAERYPELVAGIAGRGHEVACKGYDHRGFSDLGVEEFRDDLLRSREAVERACGRQVDGFRVSTGSLTLRDLWALDVLAEEGFAYDSSAFPMFRQAADEPWRRRPYIHRHGEHSIHELPISTTGPDWLALPIGGGNWFRQFPDRLVRRLVLARARRDRTPLLLYFNLWELDPELPRLAAAGPIDRIRQYRNLERMEPILDGYLGRLRFETIAGSLGIPVREAPDRPRSEVGAPDPPAAALLDGRSPRTAVTLIIPCFNETPTIPYLANTLDEIRADLGRQYDLRFVFIDDASSDDTYDMLRRTFAHQPDCVIERHGDNRGVAAAILTGIRTARTEIVCSIDSDCSYDPSQLHQMLPLLGDDVALVTASPYHPQGAVRNVPGWRLFLSRGLSRLYRLVLRQRISTYTSCFRVYRRSRVADLELDDGGFLGVAEMLVRVLLRGGRVVEAPAILDSRMLGRSKINLLRTIAGHLGLLYRIASGRCARSARTRHESRPGSTVRTT